MANITVSPRRSIAIGIFHRASASSASGISALRIHLSIRYLPKERKRRLSLHLDGCSQATTLHKQKPRVPRVPRCLVCFKSRRGLPVQLTANGGSELEQRLNRKGHSAFFPESLESRLPLSKSCFGLEFVISSTHDTGLDHHKVGETAVLLWGRLEYVLQALRKSEKVSVLRTVAATRISTLSLIVDSSRSVEIRGGIIVGSYVWCLMSVLTLRRRIV